MKGSEKQIVWAEKLKADVINTIDAMNSMAKSDPRYEANKARVDAMVTMWETRKTYLSNCNSADFIIDFFRGFSASGNLSEDIRSLQSCYKVHANNGYAFK